MRSPDEILSALSYGRATVRSLLYRNHLRARSLPRFVRFGEAVLASGYLCRHAPDFIRASVTLLWAAALNHAPPL